MNLLPLVRRNKFESTTVANSKSTYLLVFAVLVASIKHLFHDIFETRVHGLHILGIFVLLVSQCDVFVDTFG